MRMESVRDAPPPPEPTVDDVLARLGAAGAGPRARHTAVAEAAYAGRLTLPQLQAVRRSGLLPYDMSEDDPGGKV
jgi:hypothetical protein